MAFLLKSTKFIHSLIECSRQRAVSNTGKNVILSMISRSSVIQKVTSRTVSLYAPEQNNNVDFEDVFFRLSGDVRNRKVFLKNVTEIFDIVKKRGKITDPQLMLLLKCCSEVSFMSKSEERIQFAEEIWKSAEHLGINFNINHYNILLSVFLENNHKFCPMEFLKELEEKNIKPNLVTYRRILKAFCQKGDINGASMMLEKMKELNFPLSEEDFNALILCHCEMGEFHKANEILKVMEDREIEPTEKTYLNLLCGYAKHGKIKQMMDMIEELPANDKYLSTSDFLEIIYTLAVNDQCQHIDKILQKLSDDYEKNGIAHYIIHRLLHLNMDSVAFKLFEKLEGVGQEAKYVFSHSKFILRHFALYRTPKETLDICFKFEGKGWAKSAVGFVLKQVVLHKNENFCLDFLQTMMQRSINVRSHYFWPLLIRASEKGNSELLHVLSFIPKALLAACPYTTCRVVFPNYKFSDNWQADNEVFLKAGLPQKWLSVGFIEKLLSEGKMEEVERLVSLFPVDVERFYYFNFIEYVQAHPEEVERFVNIIYYLAHDFKLKYDRDAEDAESSLEFSLKNMFDFVVSMFVKVLKDEKVFEQVLQKMLDRKFGISDKGVSKISELPNSSNLVDLAKKLSDPGLQFVYDDNLLNLKARQTKKVTQYKQYKVGDEINIEELLEELAEDGSYLKTIYSVRNMIRLKRYEDALKLAKILSKSKDDLTVFAKNRLYLQVISDLYHSDEYDWAEKAFYVGVDMGILGLNDYVLCINNLFHRGQSSLAIEKYFSHVEKTKTFGRLLEFLTCVVKKGSEDDLRRVMTPMIDNFGKNFFMTYLVIAFTESGNLTKAKKLLETKKFKLIEQNLYHHCNIKAKRGKSKDLETYLKLVKDTEFLDRVPLYKLLIKKYAEEKNIEKVKSLWLLIEEDDISDYSFLEKMRELMDEPSVAKLNEIANTLQESGEMKTGELKRVAS